MKKNYTEPELELLYLFSRDVITASEGDGIVDDSDEDFMGGDIIIIG